MPTNNIKTIIPVQCPHCEGSIFMEFVSKSPELTATFTVDDIKKAKEEVRIRIENLPIDGEKKEQVLKWIADESTIFGPGEVDEIISSLNENPNDNIKNVTTP